MIEKLVYGRISSNYIHCLTAQEMHEATLDLSRTSGLIRTKRLGLFFILDQDCSTVRTSLREMGEYNICRSLAELNCCYFRDYLATFFNIYVITDMNIQQLHLIGIMQGCTLDYGSAELNRFKIGNRSYCTCPSYLIVYAQQFRQSLFCLEFICYRPTRELGSKSQFCLIWKFIDLYDYAVCRKRQILSFYIPIADELFNFFSRAAYSALVRNRKSPALRCIQRFFMCRIWQRFTKQVI